MAELVILTGPAADRRLEIAADQRFVIGRDEACNLALDDSQVSRRDAYLLEIDGRVEVGDLGSSNGTFVDGRRIERPAMLAPGDSLRIGAAACASSRPPTPPPSRRRRPGRRRLLADPAHGLGRLERRPAAPPRAVRPPGDPPRPDRGPGRGGRCRRRRYGSSHPTPTAPAAPSTSEIIAQVRAATVRVLTRVDERSAGSDGCIRR